MSKMKEEDKVPVKKLKKRKPRNHPKRPLSAYNFFFRDQRLAIVNAIKNADKKTDKAKGAEKPEGGTGFEITLDDETISQLKNDEGKISFEELGRLIGKHWRQVSPQRLAEYAELAKQDSERYKKEMMEYTLRMDMKIQMGRDDPYSYGGHLESHATGSFPFAAGAPRDIPPAGYGYQDFRIPAETSAFSHVMPPTSYPSYGTYPYWTGQQSMYPLQHSRHGMDPRYGSGGTSMSAAQYARTGSISSSSTYAPGASSSGGYGYSEYVPPQSRLRGPLQRHEPDRAHSTQSLAGEQQPSEGPQGSSPGRTQHTTRPPAHEQHPYWRGT